jgi:polysaccharide export outer membrane protein
MKRVTMISQRRIEPAARVLATIAALLFAFAAPAQQASQTAPATPAKVGGADAKAKGETVKPETVKGEAPKGEPAKPADAVVDPQYVIGPGDTVQVFVWRNPELSVTVPVRPDGKISTPLVEDMIAVGKTSSQLAREIEKVLAEYIRSPQVNIIVTNPVSTFSQVKVIGQVATPQSVPYREGLTALDVLLAVGGLTEFAAGNRAKIIRKNEAGKNIEIKVRLDALVRKGKMNENVNMKPGDVMIVPESFF